MEQCDQKGALQPKRTNTTNKTKKVKYDKRIKKEQYNQKGPIKTTRMKATKKDQYNL